MTDLDTSIKEYMAAQGGLLTAADIQQLGYSRGMLHVYSRAGLCIAALDLRNKPWINEKLSAQPASHLPPTGKPSAGHLPAN